MSVIVCSNLKVTYILKKKKYVDGLNGLSIKFTSGRVNILFGRNGCGKTTLFNCIIGQLGFDGEILFDKKNSLDLTVQERKISYVPQSLTLYPRLTVFDNIALPLKFLKYSPEDICKRVYPILTKFNIFHLINCLPSQISIGQQQKVLLAKALVTDPKIVILDEAFSNIDKASSNFIQDAISKYAHENDANIIYVTHDIEDATRFGDYFYVINNHEVIYESDKKHLSIKRLEDLLLNHG